MRRFYDWSEEDRAWMLALAEYRRLLCPCGCGQLAAVSQAAANEGRFDVHLVRCHARTAIVKEMTRRQDGETPEALMFRAELRD